ncbi:MULTISPECIES: alpha-ketoglutarate-dependent dioxygenase AlkB [unclassified Chryseobacterium]|uniref:alpha-ketoglutarate-dependent dioxygenase AlkB n=1 Tax=unclassified Chryseobacterium TaxID=2593645 RepID=UPI000D3BF37C|nr:MULTISPECIES: alpha-ketoglutarate-dependent dioxygenase AlkB [unclassified Chryseobacterium]PTT72603.1 alpha-ketoglutarate-dependent dioxygenase AlkB [Chryseobacterium sp. HMWF001]PVV50424.1 alpha-ketoglutarate-dependent dioxygenase AlkB [Chryseobacterium sp. HMWF035]
MNTPDTLFPSSEFEKSDLELSLENASAIKGLELHYDFITPEEEAKLLKHIDEQTWLEELSRRVQHYGYKYDYKHRSINRDFYIGQVPEYMQFLLNRLEEKGLVSERCDQAIVNEYINNQGISAHIDCEPCFGDIIISISLSGSCVMNFQKDKNATTEEKIPLLIPPRSLVVMKDEARYNWLHSIPNRKKDIFNGNTYPRGRRVSVTFRKVVLENGK